MKTITARSVAIAVFPTLLFYGAGCLALNLLFSAFSSFVGILVLLSFTYVFLIPLVFALTLRNVLKAIEGSRLHLVRAMLHLLVFLFVYLEFF